MKFARFAEVAQAAYDAIPEEYRAGLDGLHVSRESVPHPTLPGIWTLGTCETESYPSDWVGPDTTRSVVVLYHGSFLALARESDDFDWHAEIHETVEHEVRHHLESLAGRDELGDVDYAMDEDFKRAEGEPWDPWYWQHGERVAPGVYAAEDHAFVEIILTDDAFAGLDAVSFGWRGRTWTVPRPERLGDLHFIEVEGVEGAPPILEVVLVRRVGWWAQLRRSLGRGTPEVLESVTAAERVADPAGP